MKTKITNSSLMPPHLYTLKSRLNLSEKPKMIIREVMPNSNSISRNGTSVLRINTPQVALRAPGVQLYSRSRVAYTPADAKTVAPNTIAIKSDAKIVMPESVPASNATLKYMNDTNAQPTIVATINSPTNLRLPAISRLGNGRSRCNVNVPIDLASQTGETA